MKISNLILTFILAFAVSLTVQSQSSKVKEIQIENDDESIYIKYENGEITTLQIDGQTIDKSEYSKYQTLIDKVNKNSSSATEEVHVETSDGEERLQDRLHKKLKKYLVEQTDMSASEYKFKLTKKYIKVNGKKQSSDIHMACVEIFEDLAGEPLTNDSHFQVKISPKSKSVSLKIED